jgi:hypothetical protein
MSDAKFRVEWIDRGLEPRCKPNPLYPRGIDVDGSSGRKSCVTLLPYPARRIGYYLVECRECGCTSVITTAGRPDDPRSVRVPCREPCRKLVIE